jgi:hypothetical protein
VTDALLFLHVLSAFLLVGSVVLISSRALGASPPALTVSVAQVLDGIGGVGTLVFGVWLALNIDGYSLLDGWIIAAIVLWAISAEVGRRSRAAYDDGQQPRFVQMHWLYAALVALLLADMIFKPGA